MFTNMQDQLNDYIVALAVYLPLVAANYLLCVASRRTSNGLSAAKNPASRAGRICSHSESCIPLRLIGTQIDLDGLNVTAEYQAVTPTISSDISPPIITAVGGYYTKIAVRSSGG